MSTENIAILDADLLLTADRAVSKLRSIVPRIDTLAHHDRRNATEDAVAELTTAVVSIAALLRQITDGLLTPDASFGEIRS